MAFLAWVYLPCAVLAAGFAAAYVSSEDPVYFWDWGMYWSFYRYLGEVAAESPLEAIGLALKTIAESDYNFSGLLPLMPVYFAFGDGRLPYVAAICAFYVVPAALVTALLAVRGNGMKGPAWLAVFSALLMPVFWNAALRGMIDPIGLVPLGGAALVILNTRFLTSATWKTAAWLGMLLWLPFLLRRWYAYSIVALVALSLLGALIVVWQQRRETGESAKWTQPLGTLGRWMIAGVVTAGALIACQLPLVERILGTDYGYVYSAYSSSRGEQFLSYYANIGPVIGAFAVIGLAVDWRRRNWEPLFLFSVAAIVGIWFGVQHFAPGVQHYLPIAMMMFPACFTGIAFAWQRLGPLARLAVPALLLVNFANAYLPPSAGMLQDWRDALGGPGYPPLRLDQYAEYRRLAQDLLALGEDKRVAVFASSPALSRSLLNAVEHRLGRRFVAVGEVDLRDRFNWDALDADYAVVSSPVQLHLRPSGQQVISIPVAAIRSATGVGKSFSATGQTYRLSNGVVAELYRRNRPIPAEDLAEFKEQFYRIYPAWRDEDGRSVGLQ